MNKGFPLGIDLDDDITVKLWSDGSLTLIEYGEKGNQDEVIISKNGLVKLYAWLNKHAIKLEHMDHVACPKCGRELICNSGDCDFKSSPKFEK